MIAIIPARGGSIRFPEKNLHDFEGVPLIGHTILTALSCDLISRIIVSTDSQKIADTALHFGAEILCLRPDHLATPEAQSVDVYRHIAEELMLKENLSLSEFVVLQPTSPLRTSENITCAIQMYFESESDFIYSACKLKYPVNWLKKIDVNGNFLGDFSENLSQEHEIVLPNGAIYILNDKALYSGDIYSNSKAFLMPFECSVDIDYPYDIEIAKAMSRWKKNAVPSK